MRTIDADKVKAESREHCKTCILNGTKHCDKTCVINLICDRLDLQPTVEPKLSDKQIEEIADLLEINWGWEGIREEVTRILKGGAEG